MQKRTLKIHLGDTYHDSHGQTSTAIVEFTGTDVSNKLFQTTLDANIQRTGVNPFKLFDGTEPYHEDEDILDMGTWQQLVDNGFQYTVLDELSPSLRYPFFTVHGLNDNGISYVELLLWYCTHGTDLTYKALEFSDMFDGYSPVVNVDGGLGGDLFSY